MSAMRKVHSNDVHASLDELTDSRHRLCLGTFSFVIVFQLDCLNYKAFQLFQIRNYLQELLFILNQGDRWLCQGR
jgi:hypothetical protein